MTSVQQELFDCFAQKKGCRVTKSDGSVVDLAANTFNIFNSENLNGNTPEGDEVSIRYSDIADVKLLE